jgi:hypothetical protein
LPVAQHDGMLIPATMIIGQAGAVGSGGMHVPIDIVPHVPAAGSAQQTIGAGTPGNGAMRAMHVFEPQGIDPVLPPLPVPALPVEPPEPAPPAATPPPVPKSVVPPEPVFPESLFVLLPQPIAITHNTPQKVR